MGKRGLAEKTMVRAMAEIGKVNADNERKAAQERVIKHIKENPDDAVTILRLIESNQLAILQGAQVAIEKKELRDSMNKFDVITVGLKKQVLMSCCDGKLSVGFLRSVMKASKTALNEIFEFVHAQPGDRPIPAGMNETGFTSWMSSIIKAVGRRYNFLEFANQTVNWAKCGVYCISTIETDGGAQVIQLVHRPSGSKVNVPHAPVELTWSVAYNWSELNARMVDRSEVHSIACAKSFPPSLFDYTQREFDVSSNGGNAAAASSPSPIQAVQAGDDEPVQAAASITVSPPAQPRFITPSIKKRRTLDKLQARR